MCLLCLSIDATYECKFRFHKRFYYKREGAGWEYLTDNKKICKIIFLGVNFTKISPFNLTIDKIGR